MKIYSYRGKKNLSGDKIREARLKQRLSQSDLAAKVQIAGVTLERDSISRIEIGTRFVTDYELKIFAKVLHVNVECKKSSVKCEKYHWFLCSLFFTISILLFCAYSTTF